MCKLSVLLPVNRDDGFFERSVHSILEQSFSDFELIILANNCADELWDKILLLSQFDNRVKPLRIKLGGLTFALNYGLNIAKGDYIARMDADDICKNNRFELQIKYLDENIETVVLGTQIEFIDENDEFIVKKNPTRPTTSKDINECLFRNSPLAHPTVMFRKNEILKIGGYKYGFYGEDYELWLRCKENGYKMENLNDILLSYRLHSGQETDLNDFRKISDPVSALIFFYFKKTNNLKFIKGLFFQSRFYFFAANKVKKIFGGL